MDRTTAVDRIEIETRRVTRVYAVLARVYDDGFDWALGPGRRLAVTRLPIRPGDRVLEVGVGTGLSLPHYPPDCHITGIDISEPMLEQARERAAAMGRDQVDFHLMDARELAFPDGSFDHVLAPYVISVVPEPRRVMAEITRVCRPRGSVVVVNHFLSDQRLIAWIERRLTPVSQWIGFRMDLPVESVTATPGLRVEGIDRVNLLRRWRLIRMRREG
jgi:phosphatidylethanolamine/phosphatidyl-N-methylethanolamine N-methyltransferase